MKLGERRMSLTGFMLVFSSGCLHKGKRGPTLGLQLRRAISIRAEGGELLEKHAIASSADKVITSKVLRSLVRRYFAVILCHGSGIFIAPRLALTSCSQSSFILSFIPPANSVISRVRRACTLILRRSPATVDLDGRFGLEVITCGLRRRFR